MTWNNSLAELSPLNLKQDIVAVITLRIRVVAFISYGVCTWEKRLA